MSRRRSSLDEMRQGVRDRRARRRSRSDLADPLPRSVLRSQVKAFLICLIVFAFAAAGIKLSADYGKREETTESAVTQENTPTPTPGPGEDEPPSSDTGLPSEGPG